MGNVSKVTCKNNYVAHIRTLKQTLNHRLVLKKAHKVSEFNEKAWLRPYIGINTKLGTEAKNDFGKDFFKLMKKYGKR